MAAISVLNVAARSAARATIFTFKGRIGVNKIHAKLILPSLTAVTNGHQHNQPLHTSSVVKQELFELPKKRSEGAGHWAVERAVAVGLLVLIPAGAIVPHPFVDFGLAVMLPMHAYWGVNAVIADYLWRPVVPVTKALWLLTSILAGAGLLYLNMYDVGVCNFTASLFRL